MYEGRLVSNAFCRQVTGGSPAEGALWCAKPAVERVDGHMYCSQHAATRREFLSQFLSPPKDAAPDSHSGNR
jgi:hypothetical protein